MISDKELIELYHLKNVVRYSTRTKINKESVAEHSFYVALFAVIICDRLNLGHDEIRRCLTKAILHDMPESELNDITHDVKVKLHLYEYLEKYENEYFEKNFPKHAALMKRKDETIESVIVDIADVLSVKQYTLNELRLGNQSSEINEIYIDACTRIDKYTNKLNKLLEDRK